MAAIGRFLRGRDVRSWGARNSNGPDWGGPGQDGLGLDGRAGDDPVWDGLGWNLRAMDGRAGRRVPQDAGRWIGLGLNVSGWNGLGLTAPMRESPRCGDWADAQGRSRRRGLAIGGAAWQAA